jgi:DNA-binding MarR family transcriptional regulator
VARERSERDRRVHLLTVTPAGADALARARRVMEDVHGDIAASVTPAEAKELHALCLRLLGAEAG